MGPIDYTDAIAYLHRRIETLEKQVAALTNCLRWQPFASSRPPYFEPEQRPPHVEGTQPVYNGGLNAADEKPIPPHVIGPHQP